MINLKQIEKSSSISGIGYSEEKEVLKIRFKRKGIEYLYHKVPKKEYEDLSKAESIGKHFHEHIKGIYVATRVHQS